RRYESTPRGVDAEGHVAAVVHCPVGVNAERVGRDMCVCFLFLPSISPSSSSAFLDDDTHFSRPRLPASLFTEYRILAHCRLGLGPGIQPKRAAPYARYEGKKISVGVVYTDGCRGRA
ncbi:hypothetical protein B0H16DRAFT_1621101, partial [Mycena metata]